MFLLTLSVLPAIVLFVLVYRDDRVEKEPPGLLFKLFCFGMLSTLIIVLPEEFFSWIVSEFADADSLIYNFLVYFCVVAILEEGIKYLFLRPTRKNPNFNYTFDGIVYAVCVGLGFAAFENIMYVVGYADVTLGIMRGITAVPMHCACAVFMGYYFGLAHQAEAHGNGAASGRLYAAAYIVPVFIHGFYDFSVSCDSGALMAISFIFTIVVFILAIRRVRRSSSQDQPIA